MPATATCYECVKGELASAPPLTSFTVLDLMLSSGCSERSVKRALDRLHEEGLATVRMTHLPVSDHQWESRTPAVPLEREPGDMPAAERCCFCRAVTPFWTALPDRAPGGQVACCKACADRAEASDVPPKPDWCRREAIASRTNWP
jgi:hypothetical protein